MENFFALVHGDWFASVDGEWLKEFFESIDYLTWVSNQPSPRKSVLKNPGETQIVPGFQYGEFMRWLLRQKERVMSGERKLLLVHPPLQLRLQR